MSTGWLGLQGCWKFLLCRISQEEGMLGLIRVDQRVNRTSSRGLFESWGVLSTVLGVWTCPSTKPLDLGKWGKDMVLSIWWHCRNCVSSSDVKGGPLSVESRDGGPCWEMSSSKCVHRDWADFVETLYRKGYLLNRLQINRYSLPLWVR